MYIVCKYLLFIQNRFSELSDNLLQTMLHKLPLHALNIAQVTLREAFKKK